MTQRLLELWLPPEGAGAPLACLATTFTFDADFFTQDCLARFLGMSHAYGESDRTADVALMLEEEDLLSEARVCVLADRSCNPEARNLRWDIVPIRAPGGLLHAKTAVLIWERAMRILVGSANLTPAGYRRQVEVIAAFDIDPTSEVPRPFADSLLAALRELVALAPGPADRDGPKRRALEILDLAAGRVAEVGLPASAPRSITMAVAPASPGQTPLAQLAEVWKGTPPQRVVAMSPFWDTGDHAPAIGAIVERLAKRASTGDRTTATFVVAVDRRDAAMVVRAPRAILDAVPARIETWVDEFRAPEDDPRLLHAKVLLYESDRWIAAMIGSSNHTEAGLGLHPSRGHHELNVWFGCPRDGAEGHSLWGLVEWRAPLEVDDATWEADVDDDEQVTAVPLGFCSIDITSAAPVTIAISLDASHLPQQWSITTPDDDHVTDHLAWEAAGQPTEFIATIPGTVLASFLVIHWSTKDGPCTAAFPVNIADPTILPPPSELRDLPVQVLLGVLASTRPLRLALEHELRRASIPHNPTTDDLDPLKRFDSSELMLHRVRRVSQALWGLGQRLSRPAFSIEGLEWRLRGSVSPTALALGLAREVGDGGLRPAEAEFLLAELAMTVGTIDWRHVAVRLAPNAVDDLVRQTLADIETCAASLSPDTPGSEDDELHTYSTVAFERARSCAGL